MTNFYVNSSSTNPYIFGPRSWVWITLNCRVNSNFNFSFCIGPTVTRVDLSKILGWQSEILGEQKVVKSDKCTGDSQLLEGLVPGLPSKSTPMPTVFICFQNSRVRINQRIQLVSLFHGHLLQLTELLINGRPTDLVEIHSIFVHKSQTITHHIYITWN